MPKERKERLVHKYTGGECSLSNQEGLDTIAAEADSHLFKQINLFFILLREFMFWLLDRTQREHPQNSELLELLLFLL